MQMAVVSNEHRIGSMALHRLRDDIVRVPPLANSLAITRAALQHTIDRLEITYVVRAFTTFEATLRELWGHAFHRKTEPTIRVLIDALASATGLIPYRVIERAHEVREFRNSIVHLNAIQSPPQSLGQSIHALRTYLSFMPRQW
jgi:hypothetical protein